MQRVSLISLYQLLCICMHTSPFHIWTWFSMCSIGFVIQWFSAGKVSSGMDVVNAINNVKRGT